jgi:hypothetical protein
LLTRLEDSPRLESGYIGTDFGHYRPDTIHELDAVQSLQWWLFHDSPLPVNEERLIFWLRADLVGAAENPLSAAENPIGN